MRFTTLTLALFLAAPLIAQDDPPPAPQEAPVDKDKIRELVRQLGSEDIRIRTGAEQALEDLGEIAAPILEEFLDHDEPEIRNRARRILERILFGSAHGASILPNRLGGKRNRVARGGGGSDTEDAVLAALKWLSRHQAPDGSWRVNGHTDECNKPLPNGKTYGSEACADEMGSDAHDVGVTGLALLAFLGSAYTSISRDTYDAICFGEVVRKGVEFLLGEQKKDGALSKGTDREMYSHAIATLALVEATVFGREAGWRRGTLMAVRYLVDAKSENKGWRYEHQPAKSDSFVTFWAVQALGIASRLGFRVKHRVFRDAIDWYDEVTDEDFNRVGYDAPETGKVFIEGKNEKFSHHETLTAAGAFARAILDKKDGDPRVDNGLQLVQKDLPRWNENEIDFAYWHLGTLALFQHDGPSGEAWRRWNEKVKEALVKNQNVLSAGCENGSWDPVGRWCCEGGRVYATAINAMTLETYYRYPRFRKD